MISLLQDINIKKMILGDEADTWFIHFSDPKQLKAFITKNKSNMVTGHICCNGMGLHIKQFNNKKITNNDDISKIKRENV